MDRFNGTDIGTGQHHQELEHSEKILQFLYFVKKKGTVSLMVQVNVATTITSIRTGDRHNSVDKLHIFKILEV
jgi:hypothetical protein